MSGEQRRSGAPQGPPWTLDLLADLHADVLETDLAEELRSRAVQDSAASTVLAALDTTRHDLAGLPSPTIPEDVATRINTVLAGEARSRRFAAEAPVVDLARARQRRRRLGWGLGGLLTAAAAALSVLIISTTVRHTAPEAADPPTPAPSRAPLALNGNAVRLDRTELTEILRSHQYSGALSDANTLQACLQANGITANPIAAREITLDGRPAQLLILPTGVLGRFRLLTVGPNCGTGHPSTISDSTLGG